MSDLRSLRFVLDRHHPADAEPVFKHSEFGRPKCLLKRHCNLATVSKRAEDLIGFLLVWNENGKRKTLKAQFAVAPAVRSHQECFADTEAGVHHFVFHSRLCHAWFGRVLETAEHLHLRSKSAAVEFQRLFAPAAEKQNMVAQMYSS